MALESLMSGVALGLLGELRPTPPQNVEDLRSADESKKKALVPGIVFALSWNYQVLFMLVVRSDNKETVLGHLANPLVQHFRQIAIDELAVADAVYQLLFDILSMMMPGAGVVSSGMSSSGGSARKGDAPVGIVRRGPGRPRKTPMEPPKPKRSGPGRPRKDERR